MSLGIFPQNTCNKIISEICGHSVVSSHFTAIARGGSVPAGRRPSVLPLAGGHVQAVAGPVQDGLDLLLVRALVAVVGGGSVGVCGGSGSGLLSVGLHDPAEVGGLVGHVFLGSNEDVSQSVRA